MWTLHAEGDENQRVLFTHLQLILKNGRLNISVIDKKVLPKADAILDPSDRVASRRGSSRS
jgi:hypothetical protein